MECYVLRGKGRDKVVRVIKPILQSNLHFILSPSILLGRFLQRMGFTEYKPLSHVEDLQLSILQELIS